MPELSIQARSAVEDFRTEAGAAAYISVADNVSILEFSARSQMAGRLASRLSGHLNVELADAGRLTKTDAASCLWKGPDTWLLMQPSDAKTDAEAVLTTAISDSATVADVSDAWTVFTLDGPGTHDVLAQHIGIDLDPAVFVPGSVAMTHASHIGVLVWREMEAGGLKIAVGRSFADTLLRWLAHSGASFAP